MLHLTTLPMLEINNIASEGKREVIEAAFTKFLKPAQEFQQLSAQYHSIPTKRKTTTTLRSDIEKVSNKLQKIRKSLGDEIFKLNNLCESLEKSGDSYFKFHTTHIPKISAIAEGFHCIALEMGSLLDMHLCSPQNNILINLRRQIKIVTNRMEKKYVPNPDSANCYSFRDRCAICHG